MWADLCGGWGGGGCGVVGVVRIACGVVCGGGVVGCWVCERARGGGWWVRACRSAMPAPWATTKIRTRPHGDDPRRPPAPARSGARRPQSAEVAGRRGPARAAFCGAGRPGVCFDRRPGPAGRLCRSEGGSALVASPDAAAGHAGGRRREQDCGRHSVSTLLLSPHEEDKDISEAIRVGL